MNDVQNFALGTIWEYQIKTPGNPPTYLTSQIWILVAAAQGIGTWKRLHGSGSAAAGLINMIYLTATGAGTYTPTPGMTQCIVECVGGGGWSGSARTGAGGGGYCKKLFDSTIIGASQPYVVGAGGIGSTSTDGTSSTFASGGILMTAEPGGNGDGSGSVHPGGGVATGGDINIQGQAGFPVVVNYQGGEPPQTGQSPDGGASGFSYGFGGAAPIPINSPPVDGQLYGGGGSGAPFGGGTPMTSNGAQGIIIITEYIF
ncbi:MAG TPA: hypothetical protein VGF75_06720 [Candidatus Saccharimonadales bacterium]